MRVRDDEARLVDLLVTEEQQVEVDRPRPPLPPRALAAEAPLDVEQPVEEGARAELVPSRRIPGSGTVQAALAGLQSSG